MQPTIFSRRRKREIVVWEKADAKDIIRKKGIVFGKITLSTGKVIIITI